MYVRRHWEYHCNSTTSYTHRRCIVTLTLCSICFDTFWYTQIFALKIFTVKHNNLYMVLFHFYRQLFCSTGHADRRAIYLYYLHCGLLCIFNLQIYSMECIMPTKSRIGVLILAGIQWMRLPVVCQVFQETYGYVFYSAVKNLLYQYAW